MKKGRFSITPKQEKESPRKGKSLEQFKKEKNEERKKNFWDKVSEKKGDKKKQKNQGDLREEEEEVEVEEEEEIEEEENPEMKRTSDDDQEFEELKKLPRSQLLIVAQAEFDLHKMELQELAEIIEQKMADPDLNFV